MSDGEPVRIALGAGVEAGIDAVSGLAAVPAGARALYVFAHGAGAGMRHAFMAAFAAGLGERGIATLRYQFPHLEAGAKRVDRPEVAHAAVRAAVAEAARLAPGLPLVAGGKSFGGRMTSQAQATAALPGVRGIAFVGFPLHPAGRPGVERAGHLARVSLPMLFLQGTRDELADAALIGSTCERLGARATLAWIDGADHAFHVRAPATGDGLRAADRDRAARDRMLDAFAAWVDRLADPADPAGATG